MKRVNLKEIQVLVDDFRAEVISAILSAFPGRAVDNENPDDDIFLLDGIPVRVEGDRIVIGDDLDNYIPLKNPPIAGNPPQYREVDSIIADLKAYVGKEKREEGIMILKIKEEVRIPGTNIVLEKGDKVYFSEGHLSNSDIFFAKEYWSDLCGDFRGNSDKFQTYMKKNFFKEMAKALSLGEVWSQNALKDKLDIFLLKVATPVEQKIFGKPISSSIIV